MQKLNECFYKDYTLNNDSTACPSTNVKQCENKDSLMYTVNMGRNSEFIEITTLACVRRLIRKSMIESVSVSESGDYGVIYYRGQLEWDHIDIFEYNKIKHALK